jgi:HPt (histidine-containing phosphotransfer) domain-containing protein
MITKTTLNLSYLKTMSAGDPQTMKTLLQSLLNELNNDLPKARKLYQRKDWQGLERFCHHFKSTLSFSGDPALIKANLALWDIAKVSPAIDRQGDKLITQMERNGRNVSREVKRILASM